MNLLMCMWENWTYERPIREHMRFYTVLKTDCRLYLHFMCDCLVCVCIAHKCKNTFAIDIENKLIIPTNRQKKAYNHTHKHNTKHMQPTRTASLTLNGTLWVKCWIYETKAVSKSKHTLVKQNRDCNGGEKNCKNTLTRSGQKKNLLQFCGSQ